MARVRYGYVFRGKVLMTKYLFSTNSIKTVLRAEQINRIKNKKGYNMFKVYYSRHLRVFSTLQISKWERG